MGVHGLWKLIESSGKPVPLETLENKVLAVDVSIWLHQAVKGFQDYKGATVANAHLLGIYHRVCKLLYFKIKPIFVFDGGVPALKRQTIEKRKQIKSRNLSEADNIQKQLLSTLLKHSAISKVLSEKAYASIPLPKKTSDKYDNLYTLPSSSEFDSTLSSSSSSEEEDATEISEKSTSDSSPTKQWDLHTIDTTSHYFKSLPIETKHEILTELKETRKQSSWGRIHQLPKQSDDFSNYQMKRLLKRNEVQSALEEVSQEMGGMSLSLAELESLLKDQGVHTINDNIGKRIASDDKTRYLLIKDIHKEIKSAQEREENKPKETEEKSTILNKSEEEQELEKAIQLSLQDAPSSSKDSEVKKSKADLEEEEELRKAIELSLEDQNTSQSFLDDYESDSEDDTSKINKNIKTKKLSSAQSYMLEYSGLTPKEIDKIINRNIFNVPDSKTITKKSKQAKPSPSARISNVNYKKGERPRFAALKTITEEDSIDLIKGKVKSPSAEENLKGQVDIEPIKEHYDTSKDRNVSENKISIKSEENVTNIPDSERIKDISLTEVILKEKREDISKEERDIASDTVELMSDSDESSTEGLELAKMEIIIDPHKIEKDDLFEDIFTNEPLSNEISYNLKKETTTTKSAIEIVIDTNEKKSDNLFDDIFTKEPINKEVLNSPPKKENIEIVINPSENQKGDDLFNDRFINNQEQKEISKESLEATVASADNKINELAKANDEMTELTKANDWETEPTKANDEVTEPQQKLTSESDSSAKQSETSTQQIEVIPKMSVEELQAMKDNLFSEKIDLIREKATKERIANNITDQMYQEAQELLELFGVPYVVAPMEAEAQCAFLDQIELTDGTITDDSDIWLFGGRTVYKNFFNLNKYVMEFKSGDIEHNFKLNRLQMILLALLVGSDYTTGLQGVGPVTALEILASFPLPQSDSLLSLSHHQILSGLKEFKSWFVKGKTPGPGRSNLKNKLKNVIFTDGFPNTSVVEAYLEPTVETSREKFSWTHPDIIGLKVFAKEKFGWTINKTDEILKPVIKKLEETQHQKSIREYFKTTFKLNPVNLEGKVSTRVKSAIERMGKTSEELIAEEMAQLKKEKDKILKKSKSDDNKKPKEPRKRKKNEDAQLDSKEVDNTNKSGDNKKPKEPRKRKKNEGVPSDSKEVDDTHLEVATKVKRTESADEPPKIRKSNKSATRRKSEKEVQHTDEATNSSSSSKKTTKSRSSTNAKDNNKEEPNKETKPSKKKKSALEESEAKIKSLEEIKELKEYENLAVELKARRKRKNELIKLKLAEPLKKKQKPAPTPVDNIPKELEDDEEIKLLAATTSQSNKKVEDIKSDLLKTLEQKPIQKKAVPIPRSFLHTKEVILQRQKDKADILRNKLRAIEVFRKSKKGPGYVPKRAKTYLAPKEDAGLSEDSD